MDAHESRHELSTRAWCDPECKGLRFNWDRVLVGLLHANPASLVFISRTGEVVEALRQDSTMQWRRGGWDSPLRPSIWTPGGRYRFYLSRPSTSAPKFDSSTLSDIGEVADNVSVLKFLGGSVGAFSDILEPLGNALQLPESVFELRDATNVAAELKSLWS